MANTTASKEKIPARTNIPVQSHSTIIPETNKMIDRTRQILAPLIFTHNWANISRQHLALRFLHRFSDENFHRLRMELRKGGQRDYKKYTIKATPAKMRFSATTHLRPETKQAAAANTKTITQTAHPNTTRPVASASTPRNRISAVAPRNMIKLIGPRNM
ncbi:MAG TPA: hypothetical protein VH597_13275 [Verrucomicrobiae bacterium]|nr:hypothetical protein [Verrucomicrobiae bacterium]